MSIEFSHLPHHLDVILLLPNSWLLSGYLLLRIKNISFCNSWSLQSKAYLYQAQRLTQPLSLKPILLCYLMTCSLDKRVTFGMIRKWPLILFIFNFFIRTIFKNTEIAKEQYNAHSYTFHLDSIIVNTFLSFLSVSFLDHLKLSYMPLSNFTPTFSHN
jgi:hypothetical protein